MEPPPRHHAVRLDAALLICRLHNLMTDVGGRSGLYALVGGIEEFAQVVAKPAQLSTYFGPQRSLPKDETMRRIRTFLDMVEPAIAEGRPIDPTTLRVALQAQIDTRAVHQAAARRGHSR